MYTLIKVSIEINCGDTTKTSVAKTKISTQKKSKKCNLN